MEYPFTDADIVDIDDWIPAGEYNPHNVRPWLIHDHGIVLGIAFAGCLYDAIDALVDAGRLDSFLVDPQDYPAYGVDTDDPKCAFLGNAGEPFDIGALDAIELPNPPMSFVALFAAAQNRKD